MKAELISCKSWLNEKYWRDIKSVRANWHHNIKNELSSKVDIEAIIRKMKWIFARFFKFEQFFQQIKMIYDIGYDRIKSHFIVAK